MPDFKRMDVWNTAHTLTLQIYSATATFPRHEEFGLTNQLRRAAVSISANVAEGCGRGGQRELARFLSIALGSATELEYLLILSADLGYFDSRELLETARIVARMLHRLRRRALEHAD